jgi:hypothetical protein
MITRLNASNPVTLDNFTMTDEFRTWALNVYLEINRQAIGVPLVGAGSPEGVLDAPQYSLYLNSSGGAGTIEYRKMSLDVGGDTTKGWIAV